MQHVAKQSSTKPAAVQTRPILQTPATVTPAVQRQQQVQRDLQRFTARPASLQRQVAAPVLRAAQLHAQETGQLTAQHQIVQRQVTALTSILPDGAVETALQRQAQSSVPAAVIRTPQSPSDWVTVIRQRAEQVEGQRLDPKAYGQFTALQRQVAGQLTMAFKQDRQPAAERHQVFAAHLASLQRHPLSRPVAQVVLGSLPMGERPAIQRAVDEVLEREVLQRRQDGQALELHSLQRQLAELDEQATKPVMERIQARRGGGNPLPAAVQRHLEQGLNHDLSRVRIHDDAEADKLAKGVNAVAFTTGTDIYFRSGTFNPNTKSGLELLAHEVTHTVQQAQGKVGKGIDPDAGLEAEARSMGSKLARVMPSAKSLMPPSPHAPGVYTRAAALQRARDGAAQTFALKPLYDLQPQAVQRLGNPFKWVGDKVQDGVQAVANKGKEMIAGALTQIPGYRELTLAFGKDLVTGKTVAQNPNTILDALTSWVPGPLKDILKALKETNALPKAWAWFKAELAKLNLAGVLGEVASAIGKADLGAAKTAVTSRIGGLKALIVGSAKKIAEIGLTALAAGLGPVGQNVIAQLRKSGDLIIQVLKNPAKFAGNLLNALKGGFKSFAGNAPKHLQSGLGQWLTGASGITFPAKLDLQGVFMTALSVMGLTYQAMRGRLVKAMGPNGEKQVRAAEGTLDALKTLKGGLHKSGEMKANQAPVGNAVVTGLKSEVTKSVVMAGITKVASMLIPGGGFVQALIGAFRSVQFVIEQGKQIMGVITSAVQSVGAIAAGNIGAAVKGVENTLARSIPVALGFLGKVLGLGNIGAKVKNVITKVRGKLDALLDKAVARIRKLIEKMTPASKKGAKPTPTAEADKKKDHDVRVAKGLADIPRIERSFAKNGRLPNWEAAKNVARAVKGRHSIFKSVTPRFEKDKVTYDWVASSGSQPGSTGLMVLKLDLTTIRKELWPDRISATGKKSDGGRPAWSRPTKRALYQQYPNLHQPSNTPLIGQFKPPALLDGQDRRHIYAFDQMVTNRVSALNGQPYDPAAQLLKSWGVASVRPDYNSIWKGLKTLLTMEFNKTENLFVGEKTENQTLGREMEQGERALDKAKQIAATTANPAQKSAAQQEVRSQLGVISTKATDVPVGHAQGKALTALERNAIDDIADSNIRPFAVLEGKATRIKESRNATPPHPDAKLLEDALIEMDLLRRNVDILCGFSKSGNVSANNAIRAAVTEATAKLRQLSDYVR